MCWMFLLEATFFLLKKLRLNIFYILVYNFKAFIFCLKCLYFSNKKTVEILIILYYKLRFITSSNVKTFFGIILQELLRVIWLESDRESFLSFKLNILHISQCRVCTKFSTKSVSIKNVFQNWTILSDLRCPKWQIKIAPKQSILRGSIIRNHLLGKFIDPKFRTKLVSIKKIWILNFKFSKWKLYLKYKKELVICRWTKYLKLKAKLLI